MPPGSKRLFRPAPAAACALLTFFFLGCRQGPAPIEPAPAPAPASASAPEAPPAPPPPPMEVPAPGPVAQKSREPGDAAKVDQAVKAWLKAIESQDTEAARSALITEKEVEQITTEGIRLILVGSLLPQNRKILDALLQSARDKKMDFIEWTPGRLSRTGPGMNFREAVLLMDRSQLQFLIDDKTVDLSLDLIEVEGRWKIFKLDLREGEGEEKEEGNE